jgi:hypothetical protein
MLLSRTYDQVAKIPKLGDEGGAGLGQQTLTGRFALQKMDHDGASFFSERIE